MNYEKPRHEPAENSARLRRTLKAAIAALYLAMTPMSATEAQQSSDVGKFAQPRLRSLSASTGIRQRRVNTVIVPSTSAENDVRWFRETWQKNNVTAQELSQLRQFILEKRVPVWEQIKFISVVFRHGGYYEKMLRSQSLKLQEYQDILLLVNAASEQLTEAYKNNPHEPRLREYFDIDQIEAAVRQKNFGLVEHKKTATKDVNFCNGFLSYVRGDVYFVTSKHCLVDTTEAPRFRLSQVSDQAIRFIPPAHYAEWKIGNALDLPVFTSAVKPRLALGRPAVSFSWGPPEAGSRENVRKVHFSFILPAPPRVSGIDFARTHVPDENASVLTFLKPLKESLPRGEGIGASGSSGSLVAVFFDSVGYVVLGDFEAALVIHESKCEVLCYSLSAAGSPLTLDQLFIADRNDRMGRELAQNPPFAVLKDNGN